MSRISSGSLQVTGMLLFMFVMYTCRHDYGSQNQDLDNGKEAEEEEEGKEAVSAGL